MSEISEFPVPESQRFEVEDHLLLIGLNRYAERNDCWVRLVGDVRQIWLGRHGEKNPYRVYALSADQTWTEAVLAMGLLD